MYSCLASVLIIQDLLRRSSSKAFEFYAEGAQFKPIGNHFTLTIYHVLLFSATIRLVT